MSDTPDPNAFDRSEFELAKRDSFLQMLFKASRLANERALARFREMSGHHEIRQSHLSLFPHITFDGVRLTDLADHLEVTKQAAQQLVDDLEKMELVERIQDPSDGRAKLIRWSARGRAEIAAGVAALKTMELEYAEWVGAARLEQAHDVLNQIVDLLDPESPRIEMSSSQK